MKKWKCSLCPQIFVEDKFIEARKKRHEDKHTRGMNFKSRSNGGGNNIVGEVTWEVFE